MTILRAITDKNDKIILRLEESIQLLSENDGDNKREAASLIRKLYGGVGSFSRNYKWKNSIKLENST